jgi:MoxR-like ATPase
MSEYTVTVPEEGLLIRVDPFFPAELWTAIGNPLTSLPVISYPWKQLPRFSFIVRRNILLLAWRIWWRIWALKPERKIGERCSHQHPFGLSVTATAIQLLCCKPVLALL